MIHGRNFASRVPHAKMAAVSDTVEASARAAAELGIEAWYPDFYDTVLMNVRMKNGMMGNIDGAQGVEYGYDARVDILGTTGSLHIGGLMGSTTLTYTKDHRMRGDVIRSWMNLFYEAYVNEDSAFIEAIREDREPEARGFDGMMAVDIVRAGNESIQRGQIIYLS
jgi:myo-inositol 2-dehydrogenase/D-chiro-inositol 1-dehydrogenase/scyllo-inositol 2-dehydrogenase (NAD+)